MALKTHTIPSPSFVESCGAILFSPTYTHISLLKAADDPVDVPDVPRVWDALREPFMWQVRELGEGKGVKILWWFVAVVDGDGNGEGGWEWGGGGGGSRRGWRWGRRVEFWSLRVIGRLFGGRCGFWRIRLGVGWVFACESGKEYVVERESWYMPNRAMKLKC
ncbi:hypothetical protein HBI84_039570 [Parastagonospora nodorum]|nr:hypothetical protein HBI84_039570 [Parastagonospora nodorum]